MYLPFGFILTMLHVLFARVLRSEERKCVVRFGGLVIHNIGQLLPVQIHSGCFNTSEYVYPVCVCGCYRQFFWQSCFVFLIVVISFSLVSSLKTIVGNDAMWIFSAL